MDAALEIYRTVTNWLTSGLKPFPLYTEPAQNIKWVPSSLTPVHRAPQVLSASLTC